MGLPLLEDIKFNEKEVRECYRFLNHKNFTEIRLLDPTKRNYPKSLFPSTEEEFVNLCRKYNGQYNIYAGINERNLEGTDGKDVISVKTVVIDIDAIRARGFEKEPATDEELAQARTIAYNIVEDIKKSGQPLPVILCSGNGYQLWFAIDEIIISDGNRKEIDDKLQEFQEIIRQKYSIDDCIDKIGDLPRIIKVWGTLNIKSEIGKATQERPFRMAKLESSGERIVNEYLTKQILELKPDKNTPINILPTLNEINEDWLPAPIKYLLRDYVHSSPEGWMRIIEIFASFFRGIGLVKEKSLSYIVEWARRQPYRESNEEEEIVTIVDRIYKNEIMCPNFDKFVFKEEGYPFFGLKKKFQGVELGDKWLKFVNPVVYYLAKEREFRDRESIKEKEKITEKVSFLSGSFFDSWSNVKGYSINQIKKTGKLKFFAHDKHEITGKPIQIGETMQTIALISKAVKENKDGTEKVSYLFIDDKYNFNSDGSIEEIFALDFWLYKAVVHGKEYILFSPEQLKSEQYKFTGMAMRINNMAEVNRTLKFKSIANVFFVDKAESAVKIMSKEDLVALCKNRGITQDIFKDFIFTHPRDNCIYDHTQDYNLLTMAQILSGEYEGYPLHRMTIGPVGTGKTTEMECIDAKYKEEAGIFEAGNSTLKGLIPSFKEKPASPGYILKCNRIALTDELMKMVQNMDTQTRYQSLMSTYFGQLNMLLEHKERSIGSGNDNSFMAKATCKLFIATNNILGKNTIYEHVGLMDDTTLSRMVIWVQDKEELEKINSKNISVNRLHNNTIYHLGVSPSPPLPSGYVLLCYEFQSIVDTCYSFISSYDRSKVMVIKTVIENLAKSSMKRIWRARGLHHSILLLDGIVKFRCLFKDYSTDFTATEQDYIDLQKLLIHMVQTWDTPIVPMEWKP